jgi:hypothetical protein
MFDFLQKFRRKPTVVTVNLAELEPWFEQQAALLQKPLEAKFQNIRGKFIAEQHKLMENVGVLQKAVLKNPQITVKEIQFMEGNREAYAKKVRLFCESLIFPSQLSQFLEFQNAFSAKLEDFGKSSAKPYYVLQHFFGEESREIALSIKSLENYVISARSVFDGFSGLSIPETKNKIRELSLAMQRKKAIGSKKKECEKEREELEKTMSDLQEQKKRLVESDRHRHLQKLKAELAETVDHQRGKEKELLHEFATIEHALKKYAKITYEYDQIVEAYLKKPLQCLLEDKSFKIVKVLHHMEDQIHRESIELKDKKKDKTLASIAKLKEDLPSIRQAYESLNARRLRLQGEVSESPTEKNIRDAEMAIRNCEIRLADLEKHLSKEEDSSIDVHIGTLVDELQSAFRSVTGKTVSIKIPDN